MSLQQRLILAVSWHWHLTCIVVSTNQPTNRKGDPMPTLSRFPKAVRIGSGLLMLECAAGMTGAVTAHGNVTPPPVDTHTLPKLGSDWLKDNPYSTGGAQQEAIRVGSSGFNQ